MATPENQILARLALMKMQADQTANPSRNAPPVTHQPLTVDAFRNSPLGMFLEALVEPLGWGGAALDIKSGVQDRNPLRAGLALASMLPFIPGAISSIAGKKTSKLPVWVIDVMKRERIDPQRLLNDIDVQNPSVVRAIVADPTLSEKQKAYILGGSRGQAPK